MKTIIAATDYSATADNALRYAASLAADLNARLVLCNAYSVPVHAANSLLSPASYDAIFANNKNRLVNLAQKIATEFKIEVGWATNSTIVTQELDELVEELDAQLVVMGMHDNDWLDKISGNTTTSVLKHAHFPVLMVPAHATYNGIGQILFAYDQHCLHHNKLTVLNKIAAQLNAQVHVYHVETQAVPTEVDVAALHTTAQSELSLVDIDYDFTDVFEEDVVAGINKGIKEIGADLLVMVPHQYGFWRGLAHISKTREMALNTKIPLLTLPNPLNQ